MIEILLVCSGCCCTYPLFLMHMGLTKDRERVVGIKRGDDMEYVEIDGHKLHLFKAGDEKNPRKMF